MSRRNHINPISGQTQAERFRKWAWSDEDSWTHHIIVPLARQHGWTYGTSPIFTQAADEFSTYNPSVIIKDGQWIIYYASHGVGGAPYKLRRRTSTDGENWSAPTGDLFNFGVNGGGNAPSPSVFWDKGLSKFLCYWSPRGPADTDGDVDYIDSSDGLTWGNHTQGVIAGVGNWAVSALRVGEIYYVITRAAGNNVLALYESNSPTTGLTGIATILSNVGATWENANLGFPGLFHNSGNIYCGYAAADAVNLYKIGFAYAGVHTRSTYTKEGSNFILGDAARNIVSPCLVQYNAKFCLYYCKAIDDYDQPNMHIYQIYLATKEYT